MDIWNIDIWKMDIWKMDIWKDNEALLFGRTEAINTMGKSLAQEFQL